MPISNSPRAAGLRRVIEEFLADRLNKKLERAADAERDKLRRQFDFKVWIDDAARRVTQLQAVTHSLKPIHPDAKGTNLYTVPVKMRVHELLGSHCLGLEFEDDVVGNAAALDVYKFLSLSFRRTQIVGPDAR